MKFLNYPHDTPLSQHILSQPWLNLVVDVLNIGVKYRPRADRTVKLDLDRGGNIKNVATEKVGENLEYGMQLWIHWWDWEDEPIWYLQPFARTFLPTGGTREHRVGDSALLIGKGHGEKDGDKHFLGIRGFNQEIFEKLQTRISRLEGDE